MGAYDDKIFDSDLDAFKNSGSILTASLVFSGNIGGGNDKIVQTSVTVDQPDFFQVLFDNSRKHSGKFKNIVLDPQTLILETTFGSDLTMVFIVEVTGDTITIKGMMQNPYSSTVALQSTTINLRFIPYEGTI